jgi:hypothetical protein
MSGRGSRSARRERCVVILSLSDLFICHSRLLLTELSLLSEDIV